MVGGHALALVDAKLHEQSYLTMGKEIAYCHHEAWDGSGYPAGLKGDKIPLSARIVSLADVYDALTTQRPYKKAFSHEKATDIIFKNRGKKFDPDIVDVFMDNLDKLETIRRRFNREIPSSFDASHSFNAARITPANHR